MFLSILFETIFRGTESDKNFEKYSHQCQHHLHCFLMSSIIEKTLKLMSQMLMIMSLVWYMNKSLSGKRLSTGCSIPVLMIFLMVFLSRFCEGNGVVETGWNRRFHKCVRQVFPKIDVIAAQRWIWVKITIAMLFLLWTVCWK